MSIFYQFSGSMKKIFSTAGRRFDNFMKFWDFPDISYFPKIISRSATGEATRIYHVYY